MVSRVKSVRYLLTSQHRITDVGNFRLHPIYNLSTEASIQLLGKVAPGLTHDQMIQIANLTGNVPLALDVVGAIFNYPDPPTVEEVIQGLRDNLVATLSPLEVHSKVDASIGLAYSYLTPDLQQLCVNLSQFPGTFTRESAFNISGYDVEFNNFDMLVDMLIQRSLLHFNRATKRCHFHQLLKTYFLQKTKEKQHFHGAFQLYYAQTFYSIINDYGRHLALQTLDVEKHNFHLMFSLFKTSKHVNHTFTGVTVALNVLKLNMLELRFRPMEIMTYSLYMLEALDSYTDNEKNGVQSFLETYTEVVILVAQKQWCFHKKPDIAIKTLQSKQQKIDEGYKRKLVSRSVYKKYYTKLAACYKENGNDIKVHMCHTRILETYGQLKHCSPPCDYFSISVAYENIEDQLQAFHFRELAYEHQLASLSHMDQALLTIYLYNDYSNETVGNNIEKASNLSQIIEEEVYQYLMTADISDFSEDVYKVAIKYFQERKSIAKAVNLEHKMLDAEQIEQCYTMKCSNHLFQITGDAWVNKMYYRAIRLANVAFQSYHDLGLLKVEAISSFIIGSSLYHLGNYSDSQIWLKWAMQNVSQELKKEYLDTEMRFVRFYTCGYLLIGGDIFNLFCYGYILRDVMSELAYEMWEFCKTEFDFEYLKEESSSTEIQQKNSYNIIWSSMDKIFVTKLRKIFKMYLSTLANQLLEGMRDFSFFFKVCYVTFLVTYCSFIIYPVTILVIARIGLSYISCALKYKVRCLGICLLISYAVPFTMFLFLLGLDWLY